MIVRQPFRDQELYFQVRVVGGDVTTRSPNLNDEVLPLSEAGLRALENDQPWTENVRIQGGRVMVHSEPVRDAAGELEIVQVARSSLISIRRWRRYSASLPAPAS